MLSNREAVAEDTLEFNPPRSTAPFLLADSFANFIVGPVGCLAGDSLVVTEWGPTPIASIDRPVRVLSWNETTCRFQLSQSSVSFPKGTDYLYRVSTPQGEFDAAGSHLLLCADGEYRRVEDLQAGDVLAACSHTPQTSIAELVRSESLSGAQRSLRTDEGCLGGYGLSDRLHGLLARCLQAGVLVFAPSPSGAQTCTRRYDLSFVSPSNDLQAELSARTRSELRAFLQRTDGCPHRDAHPWRDAEGRTSTESCGYGEGSSRVAGLSRWTTYLWSQVRALGRSVRSLVRAFSTPKDSLTTSDRPIISIRRKEVKEVYWDLQVSGTHNYVTVDGAVHHNSTKTSVAIMKIAHEARRIAPCRDGIRRSRVAVIRNTRQMLYDTTIPDFEKWLGATGALLRTESKFLMRFEDVECEVLFRGLDDANDVRRLLSLQLTFGFMDEFREIHPDVYNALTGRLGRYPDKSMNKVGPCDDTGKQIHKLWGASNPPDADTWWEELLTEPPDNVHVTFQPSGMSPEADWLGYLPTGYYENLCEGKTEEWINVYVHGKFGSSLAGKPVFAAFDQKFHVAKTPLRPVVSLEKPLIIGMDFGLTPACTINQQDLRGRFLTFAELTSENMGITRFLDLKLKPLLAERFPGHPVLIIGDPAGSQRSQTDERSVFEVIKAKGFTVVPARTNSVAARISAVESLLAGQVDGGARHLIDPSCKALIKALRGGYRYKIKKSGEMEDSPEKNESSHIADGHQYACLHVDSTFGSMVGGNKRRDIVRKAAVGWT